MYLQFIKEPLPKTLIFRRLVIVHILVLFLPVVFDRLSPADFFAVVSSKLSERVPVDHTCAVRSATMVLFSHGRLYMPVLASCPSSIVSYGCSPRSTL